MSNPWLHIPLEDYEAHMSLPEVGQATMLTSEFAELLRAHAPASVAIIGCAGGNGFEEADIAGVARIVGLDINPTYVADAGARSAGRIAGLELHCADIEERAPHMTPVSMVYGALIFEYVDVAKTLRNLRSICLPGGILAAVLQWPKTGTPSVSPSPFTSPKDLSAIMRLVPPDDFREIAGGVGFFLLDRKLITLASGKQFCSLIFRCSPDPPQCGPV